MVPEYQDRTNEERDPEIESSISGSNRMQCPARRAGKLGFRQRAKLAGERKRSQIRGQAPTWTVADADAEPLG